MYEVPVKEDQKQDFLNEVTKIFCNYLDSIGVLCTMDDNRELIYEELENVFRIWGVTAPKHALIDYRFIVSLNGNLCPGNFSVKAINPEDAYVKARDQIAKRLSNAFPELQVPYDVELIKEENYPKYRVSTKSMKLMSKVDHFETIDHKEAICYFKDQCGYHPFVALKVQTCSDADWSLLELHVDNNLQKEENL